jgi:hypothetical protein
MAENPYSKLPAEAFWRSGVADKHALHINNLWKAKFRISPRVPVITIGSCFAQHISRAMKARGFNWLDSEPGPKGMSEEFGEAYNYGVFSFRTGNIYTAALLLQWLKWSLEIETPPEEIFENNGRFFDPFRPAIQPNGFSSREELLAARRQTLTSIRSVIGQANVMVFTLGLTEGWRNSVGNYEYPVCPGTIAGEYDPDQHVFHNYTYPEILSQLQEVLKLLRSENPKIRLLLTVSPVPLTATAAGKHVLVSTTYSKSVLRAVAGDLANARSNVDYFPSYEIITSAPFRAMFYEPNLRSVAKEGVAHVMEHFFGGLGEQEASTADASVKVGGRRKRPAKSAEDVVCEELVLEQHNAN